MTNQGDTIIEELISQVDATSVRRLDYTSLEQEEEKEDCGVVEKTWSQLVDWLIVVCNKTNQNEITFFTSILIIDKVLEAYKLQLSQNDMHLISITSLFIASKFNEVSPISLKGIVKNVAHNNYAKEDILNTESIILTKLKFVIPRPEFLDTVFEMVNNSNNNRSASYTSEKDRKINSDRKSNTNNSEILRTISTTMKILITKLGFVPHLNSRSYLAGIVHCIFQKFKSTKFFLNFQDYFKTNKISVTKSRAASAIVDRKLKNFESKKGDFPFLLELELSECKVL